MIYYYLDLTHISSHQELINALQKTKPDTTYFDLSRNFLNHKTKELLITVFKSMPSTVDFLDLSNTSIRFSIANVIEALVVIQDNGITSINLQSNWLGNNSINCLSNQNSISGFVSLLTAIPKSVTFLNLSDNRLDNEYVAEVFAAIPDNVISLHLGKNDLGHIPVAKLAKAFATIRRNIITLNLSGTKLNMLFLNEINQLNNLLPFVKTVYLSEKELRLMTQDKVMALKAIFPNSQIIILSTDNQILGENDLIARVNIAKQIGFIENVPTLKHLSGFFIKNKMTNLDINKAAIPEELRDYVKGLC